MVFEEITHLNRRLVIGKVQRVLSVNEQLLINERETILRILRTFTAIRIR